MVRSSFSSQTSTYPLGWPSLDVILKIRNTQKLAYAQISGLMKFVVVDVATLTLGVTLTEGKISEIRNLLAHKTH